MWVQKEGCRRDRYKLKYFGLCHWCFDVFDIHVASLRLLRQRRIQGGQSGHGPHPVLPWNLAPPSSEGNKIFILNFPNFCDYFVKKVVSEIRKCCQLQGASSL